MGQQQLLLLVLGIILVGFSVVGSTSLFSEKTASSDYDLITAEALAIATDIFAWKAKPSAYGGGADVEYLTGLNFTLLGYETTTGAGDKAHSALYFRTLRNVGTRRPFIVVRPKNNPTLRVQLYMYGPGENCVKVRRSQKVDGSWVNASMSVGVNKIPDACIGW